MKVRATLWGLVAVGAVFALLSMEATAQPKPGQKAKKIELESKKAELAASINFAADLGLSFDFLHSLGTRIDQSRRIADPVGLACAANDLAVAETVGGKKAKLTSTELMKEAVSMAKNREISKELKAVALLVKHEDTAKQLSKLGKEIALVEADAARAAKAGEINRGVNGYITAHNNTSATIYVFVNDVYLGSVNPFDNYTFTRRIGHGPGTNTVIRARSADGAYTWPTAIVDQNVQNYNATFNPPPN